MSYKLINWVDGEEPEINASTLNHMDNGIFQANNEVEKKADKEDVYNRSYIDHLFQKGQDIEKVFINVKNYGAKGDGQPHFHLEGNKIVDDEKEAILTAFQDAVNNLPATVYFPKGEYMLYRGGMTIGIDAGKGGLTICGDGDNQSIIKYVGGEDTEAEWKSDGSWVALRIQPEKPYAIPSDSIDNPSTPVYYTMLKEKPSNWETDYEAYFYSNNTEYKRLTYGGDGENYDYLKLSKPYPVWNSATIYIKSGDEYVLDTRGYFVDNVEYFQRIPKYIQGVYYKHNFEYRNFLHDITIKDIGVVDTDPIKHAIYGKPTECEETHGFDIQYCHRARIINCSVLDVGDEAIDMHACLDSRIEGNNVAGSPGAGTKGGGISVGDGCDNVIIANNTVNRTIVDNPKAWEEYKDRTNFGIAVEALNDTVKNIIVQGNTVVDVKGNGINIGSQSHGANLENIFVCDNIVTNPADAEYISARSGIVVMGSKPKSNIHISGNTIKNVGYGVSVTETNVDGLFINDFLIDGCTIRGVSISSPEIIGAVISNGIIKNADVTAIYCGSKNGKIENVTVNGVGKSATPDVHRAIESPTDSDVSAINVTLIGCKNKEAIYGVQTIINAVIEQDETPLSDGKGNKYLSIRFSKIVKDGLVNRGLFGIADMGVIDGLTIRSSNILGLNPIYINNKYIKVVNCTIDTPSSESWLSVQETGGDYNIFANNTTAKGIKKSGKNSISVNNITIPIETA